MQPCQARTSGLGVPPLLLDRWVGWVAQVRPTHGVWFVVACPWVALGTHVCAGSSAIWLLFTAVPALCAVLCVRCWGPLGSCSPVCSLGAFCCVCGVLGHLAHVHWCARSVRCLACAVSWATWLLFTSVPTRCVVLPVRCPGHLGSCSSVCPLAVLSCVCGVLGHLAPLHRCTCSVRCLACALSLATWLLFSGVPTGCVVLHVRCPGPLGFCSPVGLLRAVCCVCGVLATWLLFSGVLARCVLLCVRCPGHLGSCSPVGLLRAVSCVCGVLATWLLFTGVPARCAVLCVPCPGPLASCSPVGSLCALCCVCGVLNTLAPIHRCVDSPCCPVCAVSSATWLLFIGVPARCAVLRVRCPAPLGSCSSVCPLCALSCVCGLLGHLASVHRSAHSVRCVACAVSWATWLLTTGVLARLVVLPVRCPEPLGSYSKVCLLGALPCVCSVSSATWLLSPLCLLGALCCVCVPWASWLLFTGMPARCVVSRVRCPRPLGSCSPLCLLAALCCVCGVLGHWSPVLQYARSVCCVASAVSWATLILFTGLPARCVVLRVRCPGPLGSCSRVCPLGVLCCVCGVLGQLAPFHGCACLVCCVVVRCPGPLGSCLPLCPLGALCCVCSVLGHSAPVNRYARSVRCVACAVSWATWLPFTALPSRCVVLRVRCPDPLGSCVGVFYGSSIFGISKSN